MNIKMQNEKESIKMENKLNNGLKSKNLKNNKLKGNKLKVLISNSFDHVADENLLMLCHELGYDDWTDFDARVDEIIINWVRYNLDKISSDTYKDAMGNRIRIETVDINNTWQIQDYNGMEHINYIKVHDKNLNWVY